MKSTLSILNYFIMKGLWDGVYLTRPLLVKLIYMAQGHFMTVRDTSEPLINEGFTVLKEGLRLKSVYKHKELKGKIETLVTLNESAPLVQKEFHPLLDYVWNTYINDMEKLNRMTIGSESAWAICIENIPSENFVSTQIPNKMIYNYFMEQKKKASVTSEEQPIVV